MRPPTNNWRKRQTKHCFYAEIVNDSNKHKTNIFQNYEDEDYEQEVHIITEPIRKHHNLLLNMIRYKVNYLVKASLTVRK